MSNELTPLMKILEKEQQQLSFCFYLYNIPLFQYDVFPIIRFISFTASFHRFSPLIQIESQFHVSTFDKTTRAVFLGESNVRSVYSKSKYSVFGCKIEPSMCAFLLGDKDYLPTNQQFQEYLLQKYIQKREFQKSWLSVGIECETTTLCRFLAI